MATIPDTSKQERIAALAALSPKMLASILVEASDHVASLEANEATLLREVAAMTCVAKKWEVEADEQRAKRGALLREVQNRSCENAALKQEVADLTKRLREAEAALGVPFNDEWDSWADEAIRNA
jgi:hypothetical protein